jgi:hypothetical protein
MAILRGAEVYPVKRTIISLIGSVALVAALTAPTLAGRPTVKAYGECYVGGVYERSIAFEGSSGQIRLQILAWSKTVSCDGGTLNTVYL